MRTAKSNIKFLILSIYVLLYPILPEYFRIMGIPFYQYLTIGALLLVIIPRKRVQTLKFYSKYALPCFFLALVSYGRFFEIQTFLNYILTPLIAGYIIFELTSRWNENKIINLLLLGAVIISVCGIIEKVTGGYNVFSLIETVDFGSSGTQINTRNGALRIEGSFGQPISFALYLIFVNVLSFIRYTETKRNHRLKYGLVFLLTLLNLFFTDARMPIITYIAIMAFFIMKSKMSKKVAIILSVIFILIFDFINQGLISEMLSKYMGIIADIFSSQQRDTDATVAYRLGLFSALLPKLNGHWLFGYGNVYMQRFTFSMFGFTYTSIDNSILATLMYHGLVGLALFAYPLIISVVTSIKNYRNGISRGYYFSILLVFYIVNLFSVAQLADKRIFYCVFAVALAMAYKKKCEINRKRSINYTSRQRSQRGIMSLRDSNRIQ